MTVPIEAVTAVQGAAEATAAKPVAPPVTEAMTERFSALMNPADAPQRPAAHAVPPAAEDGGTNAIGRALEAQENYLNKTFAESDALARDGHLLTKEELFQANLSLMQKMQFATLHLNVTTAVAQSSNKGLQTLMKNQ